MRLQKHLPLAIPLLFTSVAFAQKDSTRSSVADKGWYVKVLSVQAVMPVGEFAGSHTVGAGVDFSMEHHHENRFIYFIAGAGANHYLGKKVEVSNYPYKYPGYTFVHLSGGAYAQPGDFIVRAMVGPALGFYNGNTRFNIAGRFELNYKLNDELLLGSVLNLMKEPRANSLWSAGLKVSMRFGAK